MFFGLGVIMIWISFLQVSTKEFQLMLDIFGVSKSHTPVLVAVERTGKHTHHRDLSYQVSPSI
jgi:hypothetical protein